MGGGFHGAAVVTLDAKGRVAIPTRHRAALLDSGKSLVLTAHPEGCVLMYPAAEWEPVRARVEAFPSFHPQASWWKRLLLGFEEHIAADGPGRVLLPGALRRNPVRVKPALALAFLLVVSGILGVMAKGLPGWGQANAEIIALTLPLHAGLALGLRAAIRSPLPSPSGDLPSPP